MATDEFSVIKIQIQFFSFFKDLTGYTKMDYGIGNGSTIHDLLTHFYRKFSDLEKWDAHLLVAVGVEYVERTYTLKQNDLVSIMPPVQGG